MGRGADPGAEQAAGQVEATAAEKKRLAELNAEIEELPFGETKQEREARDQIKKTLDLLMGERKPAS